MKLVLLFISVLFYLNTLAQDGFELIRKAEKKIEQGKLDKASRLLDQADSADYGFCGNAWASGSDAIALNRAKIHQLEGKHEEAVLAIWDIGGPFSRYYDSLKMTYLLQLYDQEEIRSKIDQALDSFGISNYSPRFTDYLEVNFDCHETPYSISILSVLNRRLNLFLSPDGQISATDRERLIKAIKEEPFYRLLLSNQS